MSMEEQAAQVISLCKLSKADSIFCVVVCFGRVLCFGAADHAHTCSLSLISLTVK